MKHITLLITLAFTTSLYAGIGHGHSHGHESGHSHGPAKISKEKTGEIGREQVQRLVKDKKINATWLKSDFDASVKKKFKGKTEWVVTFTNEKGIKGKKLYIFLTLSGEFVAANFSGK